MTRLDGGGSSSLSLCAGAMLLAITLLPFGDFWWARYAPGLMACAAGSIAAFCGSQDAKGELIWLRTSALLLSSVAFLQFASLHTLAPGLTLPVAVDAVGAASLVFALDRGLQSTKQRETWFKGCVKAGLALCLVSAVLYSLTPELAFGLVKTRHMELWGAFANRNMFALAAGVVIPLAAKIAITSKNYFPWLMPAAAVTGAVISSGSRSGAVILLLQWCVIFYELWKQRREPCSLMAPGAVLTCITFLAVANPETLLARWTYSDLSRTRLLFYRAAADSVWERPWLGAGAGTFAFQYAAHAPGDFGATVDHAHNDWVEWAVEGGTLLPIAVAWLLLRQLLRIRDLLLLASSASFLIASAIDYPFHRPLWTLIAFGISAITFKFAAVGKIRVGASG